MDRAANFSVMSLFGARGVTPPQDPSSPSQQQTNPNAQYHQSPQQQHVSPAQSYREPPPSSPPKTIESLFRNLGQTSSSEPAPSSSGNNPFRSQQSIQQQNNSAPATPVSSVTVGSASSGGSGGNPPPADRQSALLSLLGSTVASPGGPSASGNSTVNVGPSTNQFSMSQQPPSPPGVEQRPRPMPTGSEAQGKILLEQLMSGCVHAFWGYVILVIFQHFFYVSSYTLFLGFNGVLIFFLRCHSLLFIFHSFRSSS